MKDSGTRVRRPFLRWVGSKHKLLTQILPFIPKRFDRYFEPFLGSGSLFFHLRPAKAVLSDTNSDLVETFKAIRDNPYAVIRYLDGAAPDPDLYYKIRRERSKGRLKRASEFIYLNKTSWNGLYRVNLKGEFNVPFGAPKTDFIFDRQVILDCSVALRRRGVRLLTVDFESACQQAKAGDFVFLDPPYVTAHNNNGFIEYNEKIFGWEDQVRLANLSRVLAARGVSVVITNANHPPLLSLFDGFHVAEISRTSTLASKASSRKPVTEVVLHQMADA
jgi:DNA adenine methylase